MDERRRMMMNSSGGGMITGYIILDQTSTDPTTKVLDESGHGYSGYERPAVITAIRNASHCYVGTFANNVMSLKQLSDSDGTKYADGTSASTDITTTGKDVFMRLPYFFTRATEEQTDKWKIEFAYDQFQTATYTRQPTGNGWKQWGGNDLIGKYEAYENSNMTYSSSGKTPTGSVSPSNFMSHARARGNGYTLVKWRHHCIMAILFYAYYGHTNCQEICGKGKSTSNYPYSRSTGALNSLGMTDTNSSNGDSSNTLFWGLDNWWGNRAEYIDNIVISNKTFSITEDDGIVRTLTDLTLTSNFYASKFILGDNLDIAPKAGQSGGSDSTGYCDSQATSVISSGGPYRIIRSEYNNFTTGGVSFISSHTNLTSSYTTSSYGSRLAYTGPIQIV